MGVRAIRSRSSDIRGVEQAPHFSLQVGWEDAGPRHLYVTSSPERDSRGRDSVAHTGLSWCLGHSSPQQCRPGRWAGDGLSSLRCRGGCFSSSARRAGHMRSHRSSPVLQQEQDRGALPDGEMLLFPRTGGRDNTSGSLLRGR